ncbi:hypothetical protein [Umezawaea sp. NPDC059074]|uniref:hypothetical protein n=1 Tax=Umezawaea sp. NPDC059074 TaxID=3346716 RepID=UPI003696086D
MSLFSLPRRRVHDAVYVLIVSAPPDIDSAIAATWATALADATDDFDGSDIVELWDYKGQAVAGGTNYSDGDE